MEEKTFRKAGYHTMSNTQEKIDKRKKEAWKQKKKNQKRASSKIKYKTKLKIRNVAIAIVACLLVVAIVLPNMSVTKRWVTALKVGDTKVSSAELSYSYINTFYNYYNTMVSYVGESYVGISTSTSLRKQDMSSTQTYSDYFVDAAITNIQKSIVLASEAEKNGFTMPEEDEEEYNSTLESLASTAEYYSLSVDDYLKQVYGKGMTEKLFQTLNYRAYLADAYQEYITDGFEYSLSDLEAYYKENKNTFDRLSIRYQKFAVADATDTTEAVTLEDAKAQAEAFLAKVTDEDAFSAAALELAKSKAEDPSTVTTENTLRSNTTYTTLNNVNSTLADWAIASSRKAGDKDIIDAGDDTGYYVVYMVETAHRYEYNTVNMRHILISVSDSTDEDEMAEAKEKAEALLKEWQDGDATEESFAELADENSADSTEGGLYEQVYQGYMTDEIDEWLFDEDRKAGDCEIVYTESYGYHIVYFVGEDDPYWQVQVESTMRSNDYSSYYTSVSENYPLKKYSFGIWYRNEPF
jgi:hypothetical protein